MLRLMRNCISLAVPLALLPIAGASRAADPAWLAEVATPPAEIKAERVGHVEPLLVTADGEKIETVADWDVRRKQIRAEWMKFLGPMPEPRPEVKLEELRAADTDDFTRRLVRYEGEPGIMVEGWLLRPKKSEFAQDGKLPAICGLHATTELSIDQIAGIGGNPTRQLAPKLAERGFVVFCPRNYLWQSVENYNQAVAAHAKRHPDTLGMHKMLYDAIRGVDVLASLDDVDAKRIGTIGHSLGAKEVLYLLAFDERVKAGCSSEGGILFRSTNWDAEWYLGQRIRDESFPLNHHQVLALCAPRPLLVLGGEQGGGSADGNRSWALIRPAQEVYALHGQPVRLGLFNHGKGHDVPPEAYSRMEDWLVEYVAK
ncbi:MAG: dienelactone hydrolase family protein [Planctomycetales bacterium]